MPVMRPKFALPSVPFGIRVVRDVERVEEVRADLSAPRSDSG